MPTTFFQVLIICSNLVIFFFILVYLLQLWKKERQIEKKEKKMDTEYHRVVDNALFKERKILEDATDEASQILEGAQISTQASKDAIRQAMHKMLSDMEKEATDTAHEFMENYQGSLKQASTQSVASFQSVAKEIETDVQKQLKDLHTILLPNLQKELEAYKQTRIEQTDEMISKVIQKVAQEVLNKTISLEDHHALMIESLERAKKQAMFE